MVGLTGKARRLYNGVNKHIARRVIPATAKRRSDVPVVRLGDGHGAWNMPAAAVKPGALAYCVGVGTQASFDIAMAEAGARVLSFDPTPTAMAYMETLDYPREQMTFLPIGVWRANETLRFFQPADGIVNFSVKDIHGTGQYISAECRTLRTIMDEHGHTSIDILKLDVEGSWAEIIDSMIAQKIPVGVLGVEFDSPTSTLKAMTYINRLRDYGMDLIDIDRDNYLFVSREWLKTAA